MDEDRNRLPDLAASRDLEDDIASTVNCPEAGLDWFLPNSTEERGSASDPFWSQWDDSQDWFGAFEADLMKISDDVPSLDVPSLDPVASEVVTAASARGLFSIHETSGTQDDLIHPSIPLDDDTNMADLTLNIWQSLDMRGAGSTDQGMTPPPLGSKRKPCKVTNTTSMRWTFLIRG